MVRLEGPPGPLPLSRQGEPGDSTVQLRLTGLGLSDDRIWQPLCSSGGFPDGSVVKNLPAKQEMRTQRSPEGPRHLHRIPRLSEAPREVP